MMVTQQITASRERGKGKFRFLLGHGSTGVFGSVELILQLSAHPKDCIIQWHPKGEAVTNDAQSRIEAVVSDYLSKYTDQRPELGFVVTITEVGFDPERRNDYERAASVALRFALEDMNLPVPQIFAL